MQNKELKQLDAILTYPYTLDLTASAGAMLPPLSLGYLSAYANQQGHHVEILDCNGQNLTHEKIVPLIVKRAPKLVGISATSPIIHCAVQLASLIKSADKNIKVVIGGAHTTALGQSLISEIQDVDYAIVGEGELTFNDLLLYLNGKKNIEEIPGLIYRNEQEVCFNGIREMIEDIDVLPYPDRPEIRSPHYRMATKWNFKKPFATVVTSRGCPYLCRFCNVHNMFGRKVRYRSVDNIMGELRELYYKENVRDIIFYDDTMTVNKKRLHELCDRIINEGMKITWGCYSRVDAITDELAQKIKNAGCRMISFGVESGSNEMLKRMKKGITVEQSLKAIKICKKYGIETSVSVVVGFPGETHETIRQTEIFLTKLSPLFVAIFRLIPYPGSFLFDEYLKQENIQMLPVCEFANIESDSVLRIDGIAEDELNESVRQMYRKFYLAPSKMLEHLFRLIRNPRLFVSYMRAAYWATFQRMKM